MPLAICRTEIFHRGERGRALCGFLLPSVSSAAVTVPNEVFLLIQHLRSNICQGFDLDLSVCAYSTQDSQVVSEPNISLSLGLLSLQNQSAIDYVLFIQCTLAKPGTLIFLRFFQYSAYSPIRLHFAALGKESKKFLSKYSNLGH